LLGGRWNNPGTCIVYTSESRSLAMLEILVHLRYPAFLKDFVAFQVEIEEFLIERLDRLPRAWQQNPAPTSVRAVGDAWVAEGRSPVLQVPSAIIPAEHNYLLNPRHAKFSKLRIGPPLSFRFDPRLVDRRPKS
jgi:RES domain-containing protein